MSKFVVFNLKHLFRDIFSKLDYEEVLNFPIEIYQNFYENYNKMKESLFEKMSKAETHKFLSNVIPDDYIQKKDYVVEIKSRFISLTKEERKDYNWWGKVAASLGELMYYIDNFNIDDNLTNLKSELNDNFFKYIKDEYENLIYDTKSYINSNIINLIFGDRKKKKAIICFDCMGFEEWYVIKDFLDSKNGLDFKVGYSFSILPSETKYSSSAIFAGMVPKDIKELDIINQIHWKNEEKLFKYNLARNFNLKEDEIFFLRCQISNDINISFENFTDYNAVGLIFSFIDEITHSRRKINKNKLLKNIRIDLENSNLYKLIKSLIQQGFETYFVSDHGSIFSVGNGINVSNELFDNRAKRYLISENEILLKEYNEKIIKSILIQFKNLIGNEYLLLLSGNTMFGTKNEASLTHGGISVEEVVVPFIRVIKK